MKLGIYGAKSLALGAYLAIKTLYPEYDVVCFFVSTISGNVSSLAGLPVIEITDYPDKNVHVFIATPQDTHGGIMECLNELGFKHYLCMDSNLESRLMELYFIRIKKFASLHSLSRTEKIVNLDVYIAKFHKDKILTGPLKLPDWSVELQVGAALTDQRVALYKDDEGEHISFKNPDYCELTALYWIWKNRIMYNTDTNLKSCEAIDYYGLFHYRRYLDINEEDLKRLSNKRVDVILPYPTIHEPSILEHHKRYVNDECWDAMVNALNELNPEYFKAFNYIMSQQYFYNYNIFVATGKVLADYCAWLFPILNRTEENCGGKGSPRYIGYLGENLLTLYFMTNEKRLNIVHTGRIMVV